ncbi:hypothetical protein AB4Y40_30165 [Paraburkholderia sp. EG287B]|uniref:hypothetical protein n=1 Tax=Paraburkholderia sp. EG287B TaxID=3237010 RepID=UPI0034D17633
MSEEYVWEGDAQPSAGVSLFGPGNALIAAGGAVISGANSLQVSTSSMFTSALVTTDWQVSGEDGDQLGHVDQMYRFQTVQTDELTRSVVGHTWETREFVRGLRAWAVERTDEVNLLRDFAIWQKRKLDFAGVYAAYLLDAITDDEFDEESLKYAIPLHAKCEVGAVGTAEKLVSLLPFELTTADLAEFLKTEPRALLRAIAQTKNPSQKLKELLPSQTPELDDK